MARLYLKCFVLITVVFIFTSIASANGPADKYEVTVSTFELSSDGTNYTTVFSGTSSVIDIAAGTAGQSAGNFMSGLAVPDGTYTHCRVTPSATMTVRGNDGTSYTAGSSPGGGCTVTTNAALKADCTVTLPSSPSATIQNFSATPIVVKDGVPNHKVRVVFDVSTALRLEGDGKIWPQEPSVEMTAE